MKNLHKSVFIAFLVISAIFNTAKAQQELKLDPVYFHVFDKDSLNGFDEEAARAASISEQYLGAEFKVHMYHLKRAYINNKYNIWPKPAKKDKYDFNAASKLTVVPGCTNEDFEASTAGSVTTQNQIAGWTITRGNVQPPNNGCNLGGCCSQNPVESELFVAPNGFVDPVIGSVYPIFSVFGTSAGDPNGPINNPQIVQGMFGNNFIRINSSGLGAQAYSIERLSKTFAVTANNALFQFAFISVFSSGHTCCSGSSFQIHLFNASANTVIACPSFSVNGPSSQCVNTVTPMEFLVAQTGATANVNSGLVFNKWKISSMDLTAYIGQNVTIEVTASDCDASGHYGYAYFDAQCGPMVVYGNNVAYGAGSGSINVPTCGAAGATLCASSGLGPYYWAGPGVNPPFNTAAYTNQCYITNISGTYTLYMNPPGSCAPIERVINATITPAPLLFASVVQAVCGGTTAVVTITPSGSAAVPQTLSWSPAPLALNGTTTQATYVIPPGPGPINVTITASDNNGCYVTTNASVNPAPPIPSFSINNVTGTSSITCVNLTVNLAANTSYTYGSINYVWAGTSANYTGQSVFITNPGTYTVSAFDPVSQCYSPPTLYVIGANTTPPTSTLAPMYQLITCTNSAIQSVTVTSTPSTNIIHTFSWGIGGGYTASNATAVIAPSPGTNTYVLTNLLNGCTTTKIFTVATSQGFPTYTLASPIQNFSIGCAPKHTVDINIVNPDSDPPGQPVTFAIWAPNTGTTPPPFGSNTSYTYNLPGTYTVIVKDVGSSCESKVSVSIIQNTIAPDILVTTPTYTLSCFTPSVILVGSSQTPNTGYQWAAGSLVTPGSTYTVNTTASTTNSNIAVYTFSVTNNTNACKSQTLIPMYQNIYVPTASVAPQNGGTGAISCKTPSITLTNQSKTGIPPGSTFPVNGQPSAIYWEGPSPQVPKQNSSNYLALIPGPYTMTVKDPNNGCTSFTVFNVGDNRDYPVVNNPIAAAQSTMDCGSTVATVSANITGTVAVKYEWYDQNGLVKTATLTPSGGGGVATASVGTIGEFPIIVTNESNGCVSTSKATVVSGALFAGFNADNISGFAPLTVIFTNSSASSLGTSSITSVWNFGNGSTATVIPANYALPVSATYNQPGTYSVTLFTNKGFCQDVKTKTITVEIPSKLEVPNVFTPNGDGANDVFFLRIANITEIKVTIYDRWGNLVYELSNTTGNIEWDGKNQAGKEVAEGSYFYMITATGKDGKSYDTKGTVSLYR